ncbi:DegT/DnrJ/EryC1/StrS family aminotransferase [Candidatus Nitrospira bockiana]
MKDGAQASLIIERGHDRPAPAIRAERWRRAVDGRFRALPPVGAPIPFAAVLVAIARTAAPSASAWGRLAARLTAAVGCRDWIFTVSGRSALAVALAALSQQRPDRDEVIVPAYTSYSVPAAVVKAGFTVRLCDIEGDTLGLAPDAVEAAITKRTLAIVAHHLYGLPCRIHALRRIADLEGVPLVEDAAQGMGLRCRAQPGGATGHVVVFSVSRGKTLPGAGGGIIGMNDPALAAACRDRVRGRRRAGHDLARMVQAAAMAAFLHPTLYWMPAAVPWLGLGRSIFDPGFEVAPMTAFQRELFAALLPHEARLRRTRQARAALLAEALAGSGLRVLWPRPDDEGAFLRLAVLAPTAAVRGRLLHRLREAGLGATEGFPLPLERLEPLRPWLAGSSSCPTAEEISRRLITLPTHAWVTARDAGRIAEEVRRCA